MEKEMRLIDANALREKATLRHGYDFQGVFVKVQDIDAAPTVDAAPVVHGRWIFDFSLDDSNFYRCSVCGRQEVLLAKESTAEYFPYCHCGAKMDLEGDDA